MEFQYVKVARCHLAARMCGNVYVNVGSLQSILPLVNLTRFKCCTVVLHPPLFPLLLYPQNSHTKSQCEWDIDRIDQFESGPDLIQIISGNV